MSSEAQEICEAVASYLHYKSLTGLSGLLNEYAMAVPIAEYLSTRHGREVRSEVAHPVFRSTSRGRPKQIDFVRLKRGENTWQAAYETKFQTVDFKKIVFDLCRLVCLSQDKSLGNPDRFFIYAARPDNQDAILSNCFNDGGERVSYFDLLLDTDEARIGSSKTFPINGLRSKQREAFRAFAHENNICLPSAIRVVLAGSHETGGFTCAIWQVYNRRGAKMITSEEIH